MNYNKEHIEYIALSSIDGLGDASLAKIIDKMGSVSKIFASSMADFRDIGIRISNSIFDQIKSSAILDNAEKLLEACSNNGVKVLSKASPDYPYRLKDLKDSPAIIYCNGDFDFNVDRAVAIVGTRNATAYGYKVVEEIVSGLVEAKPLIVSGLAHGIDCLAHKKSLEMGLKTTAVFAGGIDRIYPSENISLARQIAKNGGLVTEYPMGVKVETFQFAARNRIIAGMVDATIVVEAPKKSGALITAEMANVYGREVFSVPGSIVEKNSEGCLELIKNHKANIFTSINDFNQFMGWKSKKKQKATQVELSLDTNLNETEKKVYRCLKDLQESINYDYIVEKTLLAPEDVSKSLLNLEMKGIVDSLPGKKFIAS